MSFPESTYLPWAIRFYGKVPFDLATSGTPVATLAAGTPRGDDATAHARLRYAVARYNAVPVTEAIVALGTTHAIWLAYATLVAPGDDVLVESPAYEPLVLTALGVGARVHRFERAPDEGYALDPARVAAGMTPRTRVVAVTNLHNPSGTRADPAALREVARIARAHGARLLVDEVYAPFDDLVGADGVWGRSARALGENVVAIASLTKCYGLGAERVGWLLASADVIARAEGTILATAGALPLAHAHHGVEAFAEVASFAERSRGLLAGKRAVVERWIASHAELTWSAPREGLFGFAISSRGVDLRPVIERGAEEHGVLVAPGSFFGIPGGFRIAWSIDASRLSEGLARLGRALAL